MAKENPFDPDLVRELANLIADTGLSEIEVEKGDLRIRVARTITAAVTVPCGSGRSRARPGRRPASGFGRGCEAAARLIRAPFSRRWSAPPIASPPRTRRDFVEVGSKVQAGEKVLLVEAMKTFNEIVAPRAGTVTAIYVEDGTPVEYGEPLLVIE